MSLVIIRQTIRETLRQPALLFLLLIQLAFLGLLIAGLQLTYDQGTLISMRFFSGELDETEAHLFLRQVIPNIVFFLAVVTMFLLIVGTSSIFPDMLQDPLLGITLTKPITRNTLLTSKVLGVNLAVLIHLFSFALFIVLTLLLKTGGVLVTIPITIAFSLFLQFFVVSALAVLFAMVVENGMGVALLSLAVYFLLRPLFIGVDTTNTLLRMLIYAFPPFGDMEKMMREALSQNDIVFSIGLSYPLYIVVYLSIALFLFNRKDLR